jgi:HK97 family phage major capsid protein
LSRGIAGGIVQVSQRRDLCQPVDPVRSRRNLENVMFLEGKSSRSRTRRELEAALAELHEVAAEVEAAPDSISEEDLSALESRWHDAEERVDRAEREHELQAKRSQPRQGLLPQTKRFISPMTQTYTGEPGSPSFFSDIANSRSGDQDAIQRIANYRAETRDLSATDGTGGDFLPAFALDSFIDVARSAAPLLNALPSVPLPPYSDTITLPKLDTGASVAAQLANGNVSETDPTTSTVSIPVVTVAGQTDVARQVVERSYPGLDRALASDLAAAYSAEVERQIINGSGSSGEARGLLNQSGINTVTYTVGTPGSESFGGILAAIADAYSQVCSDRKLAPTHVVLHPRRWAMLSAELDTANRPIITPDGQGPANSGAKPVEVATAEGVAGRILGMDVILSTAVPTTLGASTNEDRIIVLRAPDLYLAVGNGPTIRTFEETLSSTATIRFQVFGYSAFSAATRPDSVAVVSGTGLRAPTFS